MKRILYFFGLITVVLVAACRGGEGEDGAQENDEQTAFAVVETVIEGDENKTLAHIGIEGMTCAMGCAKVIESTLRGTDGVASVEVVFEEEMANIEYDPNRISEKELMATITGVSDSYGITSCEVQKHVVANPIDEVELGDEAKKNEEGVIEKVSEYAPTIEFPNIFDLLNKLYPQ